MYIEIAHNTNPNNKPNFSPDFYFFYLYEQNSLSVDHAVKTLFQSDNQKY